MRTIRYNVFETNSSSTHSITMCNKDDYEKWLKGETWLNRFSTYYSQKYNCFATFIDKNVAFELYKIIIGNSEEDINKFKEAEASGNLLSFIDEIFEGDLVSIDKYNEYAENFEEFEDSYTTENGETIIAFGCYGYDV